MGFDLNRHWQDPSPWAHPTLHAVKQLIVQMNQDPVSIQYTKAAKPQMQPTVYQHEDNRKVMTYSDIMLSWKWCFSFFMITFL